MEACREIQVGGGQPSSQSLLVEEGSTEVASKHLHRALWSAGVVPVTAGSAATWRVANAVSAGQPIVLDEETLPDTYPRLDRAAPSLGLIDQRGDTIALATFSGSITLVTFAFAHCETVCPAVVRDVLEAHRLLADSVPMAAVVVTLDPWRDTPSRLPYVAQKWELGEAEHVVSGSVEHVEAVLDAWNVPRRRDPQTGDVTHPALVYLVDPNGTIVYAARGGVGTITSLAARL
jgi:protein SCO1/2